MAVFNDGMTPLLPFGRWDLACMAETQGGHEKRRGAQTVRRVRVRM